MSGEKINFAIGCVPNLIDLPVTALTSGGEDVNRVVEALATADVNDVWRTPTLKPFQTWVQAYLASLYPIHSMAFANLRLPEVGSYYRKRASATNGGNDSIDDEVIRPDYRTSASANTLLATTNTTGSPSDLDDDPLAPDGSYVTPTSAAADFTFRVRMRKPLNPPKAGDLLQKFRVTYAENTAGSGAPFIQVLVYQNGVFRGVSIQETAFPAGETGHWVVDLHWNAAILSDPSGANVEVGVYCSQDLGSSIKIAAVEWRATVTKRLAKGASVNAGALLEAVNVANNDGNRLNNSDVFNPDLAVVGIAPSAAGSAMTVRGRFSGGATDYDTGSQRQAIIVCWEPTGAAGTPSFTLELYVNGAASGITTSGISTGAVVPHWTVLLFSYSDISANINAVEFRVVTTPNGGSNIKLRAVDFWGSQNLDPYLYDSGWAECFPALVQGWDPSQIALVGGGLETRSLAHVNFDSAGEVETVTCSTVRVEFLAFVLDDASANYSATSFEEHGETFTWLDVGRWALGPALTGMKLAGGFAMDAVDLSVTEVSDGGVMWIDQEAIYRRMEFKLTALTKELALGDMFDYLLRRVGTSTDVLFMVFPEDASFRRVTHVWGPFERVPKLIHDFGTVFRSDLGIRERI